MCFGQEAGPDAVVLIELLDRTIPFENNHRMRIVTWNMGQAGRSLRAPGLHEQAWHYLLGLGPDLAFLQETLPPAWVRGAGQLISGPFKQWGSVIFSPRLPLEPVRLPEASQLRTLGSYLAMGSAWLPDGTDALVVSVHARPEAATPEQLGDLDPKLLKRQGTKAAMVNDLVFFGLKEVVRARFIAAGDWNTGREQASESGRRAGAEFFDRVERQGWYDCVWDKVGRELRTWFPEGSHLLQDDHVFCDQTLGRSQVTDPWVAIEAATELGLSDHAPLVLDLDVPSIAMSSLTTGATELAEGDPSTSAS